ncbi:peptidase E [Janibacter cremeus]|uniref:Peptidase E n=1 Tax=Janibacter cremeus TaxID=1285192 RepID=A0A852VID4_9MICO|nr:peptidase E [Janibacter cremeus]NYF96857.1 peptidase E [Janibacter cremeus]
MPADSPTILATSGGYLRPERGDLAFAGLVHHAVDLSGTTSQPKVCQLGTASGDPRPFNAAFCEAGAVAGYDVTNLNLFPMPSIEDIEGHLLAQDVVWVNGGSVANLLAVWRVHDLDTIFRRVWEAGVVLAGVSAGSICWYRGGTTDSFGPELRAVTNGLGLLPYDNGIHYDSEECRRPTVHALVEDGTLRETHCTDDGVGLVYRGSELVEAVTEQDGKSGYIVAKGDDGRVVETPLDTRRLPR